MVVSFYFRCPSLPNPIDQYFINNILKVEPVPFDPNKVSFAMRLQFSVEFTLLVNIRNAGQLFPYQSEVLVPSKWIQVTFEYQKFMGSTSS